MTNEQKAQTYNRLMSEFGLVENRISYLKNDNLNPTQQILDEIRRLEIQKGLIMREVERLMS